MSCDLDRIVLFEKKVFRIKSIENHFRNADEELSQQKRYPLRSQSAKVIESDAMSTKQLKFAREKNKPTQHRSGLRSSSRSKQEPTSNVEKIEL